MRQPHEYVAASSILLSIAMEDEDTRQFSVVFESSIASSREIFT
jgi:hypothetical protein